MQTKTDGVGERYFIFLVNILRGTRSECKVSVRELHGARKTAKMLIHSGGKRTPLVSLGIPECIDRGERIHFVAVCGMETLAETERALEDCVSEALKQGLGADKPPVVLMSPLRKAVAQYSACAS